MAIVVWKLRRKKGFKNGQEGIQKWSRCSSQLGRLEKHHIPKKALYLAFFQVLLRIICLPQSLEILAHTRHVVVLAELVVNFSEIV